MKKIIFGLLALSILAPTAQAQFVRGSATYLRFGLDETPEYDKERVEKLNKENELKAIREALGEMTCPRRTELDLTKEEDNRSYTLGQDRDKEITIRLQGICRPKPDLELQ